MLIWTKGTPFKASELGNDRVRPGSRREDGCSELLIKRTWVITRLDDGLAMQRADKGNR